MSTKSVPQSSSERAKQDQVQHLSSTQRALFEAMTARERRHHQLRRRDADVDPVMSFSQRRLWFLNRLRPDSSAYNVPFVLKLVGALDEEALRGSVDDVLRRHEVLRTVYRSVGGQSEATPVVLTDPVPWRRTRLGSVDDLSGELVAELGRSFDLTQELPVRASLFKLTADEHVICITIHHIAIDGWSVRLLAEELTAGYVRRTGGGGREPAPLPIQYADYAHWQRNRMTAERQESLRAYWAQELADMVAPSLPLDHERPAVFPHKGASRFFDLPPDLTDRLRDLSRAGCATLYMTLLAGFVTTLRSWTGQDDLVVGTSVSGREEPQLADLIGFFVNTLPVRVRTQDNERFSDVLASTRKSCLDAYTHQDLAFDVIVDEVGGPRDPSRVPLTPVMFVLDETSGEIPPMGELTVSPVDVQTTAAKYELLVSLQDNGANVRALVEYPTALFDATTIERLMESYLHVLRQVATHPDIPLVEVDPVAPQDRRRQLTDWNATRTEFTQTGSTLHGLVERQIALRPDAVAVVDAASRESWDYRTLGERAKAVAAQLLERGFQRGEFVGVSLPRSPELVAALLGVLKAGGVFAPVDPAYPPERRRQLAEIIRPRFVITSLGTDLSWADGAEKIVVPGILPVEHLADVTTTDHASAYVIFTSGSTGVPKAIEILHRGVVNNLLDLNTGQHITSDDAVLALSSPSFDMSVYENFGILAAGGRLVIPDQSQGLDPGHWAELIDEHRVTVWNTAPAFLELLLGHLDQHTARTGDQRCGSLRVAFLGGDWIPVSQPDRLRSHVGSCRVVALGGATEVSIHSTQWVADDVDLEWAHLPYGRPMANQRAYILDEHCRLLPTGVVGQLYLGGRGLARGYVGDPELTARKFVQVQLGERSERLYCTGDMARLGNDGNIHLLGRLDTMIKLQGIRIEAGEVEHALLKIAGIEAAVVTLDRSREALVAHVAPKDVDRIAVRDHLSTHLPKFMVPRDVVTHDQLPLTPNGKVDRVALVGMDLKLPVQRTESENPLEAMIVRCWSEILRRPVRSDENFFDAGGDSFSAVRALQAVAEELDGPSPSLTDMFREPTPRALAARIIASSRPDHELLQEIRPAKTETPRFTLVGFPFGGGDAIAYLPLSHHLPDDIRLLAVSPPGHDPLRPAPFQEHSTMVHAAADAIIDEVDGPVVIYGHCAGVVPAIWTAKVLEARGRAPQVCYLAAAYPDEDPQLALDLDKTSSDADIIDHLRALDGFDSVLPESSLTEVVAMVRHDMTQAAKFFLATENGWSSPLAAPVVVIIGDDDLATESSGGHLAWRRYARNLSLLVIPGGRHYFLQHMPELLAPLLTGAPPARERRQILTSLIRRIRPQLTRPRSNDDQF